MPIFIPKALPSKTGCHSHCKMSRERTSIILEGKQAYRILQFKTTLPLRSLRDIC